MRKRQTRNGSSFKPFSVAALVVVAGAVLTGPAMAQAKANPPATAAGSEEPAPKQVPLTQAIVDHLIAAQKQIRDAEAKQGEGKKDAGDPKALEGKMEGIAKANGFASMGDFADASYSVGVVLSGMDPDGNTYIGTQAALKKQVDEVKADKKMPASEKKEALDELNEAMKSAASEKPLPGNIDIVKTNAAKLNEGMQQDD